MTENTTSKKSITVRIIRWLIYGLTILVFVLATTHNDHLHKLNSDQFGPPDYYYDYYLHDSMWFIVAMLAHDRDNGPVNHRPPSGPTQSLATGYNRHPVLPRNTDTAPRCDNRWMGYSWALR